MGRMGDTRISKNLSTGRSRETSSASAQRKTFALEIQEDSWESLMLDPAFFYLRDFSGHLIRMIIVHLDDRLLTTNNSHQADSHICRSSDNTFHRLQEGRQQRRGLVQWETNSDSSKTWGIGFATRPDGVCEDSLWTCKYVSSSSQPRGGSVYNNQNHIHSKYDPELALGNTRGTPRRVVCCKSVAQETVSTLSIRSQAGSTNRQTLEKSARNWF